MKLSNSLIANSLFATAVVAALPLAAFAGEKDKTAAPMGATTSAEFDKLDTNRDGRISQTEAASDTKIVFSTADKNSDGYLDSTEYSHRDMSSAPMPNSAEPVTDAEKPRQ